MFTTLQNRLKIATFAMATLGLLANAPYAKHAVAQELGDRAEIERKKKEREEAEKAKAAMEIKETEEQRENRERMEKREANIKLAKVKFAQAAQAAAKRQNDRGLELMEAAWYLDPQNLDYPLNTAEFAKALQRNDLEFRALAAVKVLAKRNLANLGADSPKRSFFEDALQTASARMEVVHSKLSVGTLQVSVEPANCEIYLESAFVGIGSGEIESITGQRKVESRCTGYFDHEMFVNVHEGDPTVAKVKPNPVPYFGKLVVRVEPADGVTVLLDDTSVEQRLAPKPSKEGAIVGKGTKEEPYQLAARKWIIRFQKDGYDRWHRRIDIRRDQVTVIEARLESLADLEADKAVTGTKEAPVAPPKDKPKK